MKKYYIAVDIGASSGRLIAAHLDNGIIKTEEIHRFDNGVVRKNGRLCWKIDKLFCEIKNGLKKCAKAGIIPATVGIDTWAVDYVLLDQNGDIIGDTVAYRDSRTDGMIEKTAEVVPQLEQYEHTGIQPQVFNTIYQLMSDKEQLNKASRLLFVPEYLNYLLTGVMMTEYTNASTSGLVSVDTKDWDLELIDRLGYPRSIFGEIHMPSTVVGKLKAEIAEEVGFSCDIILPCTHDTGSAVLAVPSNEKALYISSGTWSLMGCEIMTPDVSEESLNLGFTNEGGFDYRFRYLKNIMGLWMIQSVRRELNKKYSFDELCDMAKQSDFDEIIDVNDKMFLAPDSMIDAISNYCQNHNMKTPQSIGDTVRTIYHSLAKCYADTVNGMEKMLGISFGTVNIVGGGSKDGYLNELTAKYTGKPVTAGPTEATAIGNILVQMIAAGEIESLADGRNIIKNSFDITEVK